MQVVHYQELVIPTLSRMMLQHPTEELVGCLPRAIWKVVRRVRIVGLQLTRGFQQSIDLRGSEKRLLDARHFEVIIAQRRANENGSRCQPRDQLRKVKGHPVGIVPMLRGDARHVAIASPPFQIPFVVAMKAREATAGDHRSNPRIVKSGENRVVSTQ